MLFKNLAEHFKHSGYLLGLKSSAECLISSAECLNDFAARFVRLERWEFSKIWSVKSRSHTLVPNGNYKFLTELHISILNSEVFHLV